MVFLITSTGFEPGEEVTVTSHYKDERNTLTPTASMRGTVEFPVMFGAGDVDVRVRQWLVVILVDDSALDDAGRLRSGLT